MNKHVKPTQPVSADLSRRSFLVGSAAADMRTASNAGTERRPT